MSEIILQANGLTKYYDDKCALNHFNLKIEAGCICGFIGRNGSGKTTAIKLLLGFLKPTAGSSSLFGCDSQNLTPSIRQRVGYVAEGHKLIPWMSIKQIEQYQSAFYSGQWDKKFFDEMIEYFGLSKKHKIKHLSNGQRAQVSLALTLACNPELLIMDDPSLGLDAAIRRQFLEGMIQLIMKQGRTILFSSHILGDVERVADRLVVIDKGVVRADCTLEHFRNMVKKVRVVFKDSVPERIDIDGLLNSKRDENELELILVGTDDEIIRNWAVNNKVSKYNIVSMNLEDQFIEYTTPAGKGRLFDWEK